MRDKVQYLFIFLGCFLLACEPEPQLDENEVFVQLQPEDVKGNKEYSFILLEVEGLSYGDEAKESCFYYEKEDIASTGSSFENNISSYYSLVKKYLPGNKFGFDKNICIDIEEDNFGFELLIDIGDVEQYSSFPAAITSFTEQRKEWNDVLGWQNASQEYVLFDIVMKINGNRYYPSVADGLDVRIVSMDLVTGEVDIEIRQLVMKPEYSSYDEENEVKLSGDIQIRENLVR